RPALGEEPPHRRVFAQGLEQLDSALADPHRRGADALVVHSRPMLDLGAEEPLIGRERLVEVAHCPTEVKDPPRFHLREANGWTTPRGSPTPRRRRPAACRRSRTRATPARHPRAARAFPRVRASLS